MEEAGEFDIYGDLEDFDAKEQLKAKEIEVKDLTAKLNELIEELTKIQNEKKQITKDLYVTKNNTASLLQTAKMEIQRKDSTITDLRKEKDDICFRRLNTNFKIGKVRQKEDCETQTDLTIPPLFDFNIETMLKETENIVDKEPKYNEKIPERRKLNPFASGKSTLRQRTKSTSQYISNESVSEQHVNSHNDSRSKRDQWNRFRHDYSNSRTLRDTDDVLKDQNDNSDYRKDLQNYDQKQLVDLREKLLKEAYGLDRKRSPVGHVKEQNRHRDNKRSRDHSEDRKLNKKIRRISDSIERKRLEEEKIVRKLNRNYEKSKEKHRHSLSDKEIRSKKVTDVDRNERHMSDNELGRYSKNKESTKKCQTDLNIRDGKVDKAERNEKRKSILDEPMLEEIMPKFSDVESDEYSSDREKITDKIVNVVNTNSNKVEEISVPFSESNNQEKCVNVEVTDSNRLNDQAIIVLDEEKEILKDDQTDRIEKEKIISKSIQSDNKVENFKTEILRECIVKISQNLNEEIAKLSEGIVHHESNENVKLNDAEVVMNDPRCIRNPQLNPQIQGKVGDKEMRNKKVPAILELINPAAWHEAEKMDKSNRDTLQATCKLPITEVKCIYDKNNEMDSGKIRQNEEKESMKSVDVRRNDGKDSGNCFIEDEQIKNKNSGSEDEKLVKKSENGRNRTKEIKEFSESEKPQNKITTKIDAKEPITAVPSIEVTKEKEKEKEKKNVIEIVDNQLLRVGNDNQESLKYNKNFEELITEAMQTVVESIDSSKNSTEPESKRKNSGDCIIKNVSKEDRMNKTRNVLIECPIPDKQNNQTEKSKRSTKPIPIEKKMELKLNDKPSESISNKTTNNTIKGSTSNIAIVHSELPNKSIDQFNIISTKTPTTQRSNFGGAEDHQKACRVGFDFLSPIDLSGSKRKSIDQNDIHSQANDIFNEFNDDQSITIDRIKESNISPQSDDLTALRDYILDNFINVSPLKRQQIDQINESEVQQPMKNCVDNKTTEISSESKLPPVNKQTPERLNPRPETVLDLSQSKINDISLVLSESSEKQIHEFAEPDNEIITNSKTHPLVSSTPKDRKTNVKRTAVKRTTRLSSRNVDQKSSIPEVHYNDNAAKINCNFSNKNSSYDPIDMPVTFENILSTDICRPPQSPQPSTSNVVLHPKQTDLGSIHSEASMDIDIELTNYQTLFHTTVHTPFKSNQFGCNVHQLDTLNTPHKQSLITPIVPIRNEFNLKNVNKQNRSSELNKNVNLVDKSKDSGQCKDDTCKQSMVQECGSPNKSNELNDSPLKVRKLGKSSEYYVSEVSASEVHIVINRKRRKHVKKKN